jgi:hypothetical protein
MTPVRTIELFTLNSTNIDAIQLYYSDKVSASGMKQRIGQFGGVASSPASFCRSCADGEAALIRTVALQMAATQTCSCSLQPRRSLTASAALMP